MGDAAPELLVSAFRCRFCETIFAVAAPRCPACGKFNCLREEMVKPAEVAGRKKVVDRFLRDQRLRNLRRDSEGRSEEGGPDGEEPEASDARGDEEFYPIVDYEEEDEDALPIGAIDSEEPERVQTHIDEIDEFFNGGVPVGNAIMIGGDAGIGKSSFGLQMLSSIARRGRKTLIITGEEESSDIAQRLRRFNGFSANVAAKLIVKKTDLFERALQAVLKVNPAACLLDSLPVFRSIQLEQYDEGSPKLMKLLAKTLRRFAAETGVVFFVIVHEAKSGRIAGPNAVKHLLHGATRFEQPFKKDSEEAIRDPKLMDIRKLAFEGKYRGGPTSRFLYFTMDNDGLHPVDEEDLPIGLQRAPEVMYLGGPSPADRAVAIPKRKRAAPEKPARRRH
jgi:predicted ATP-dependent serine protease